MNQVQKKLSSYSPEKLVKVEKIIKYQTSKIFGEIIHKELKFNYTREQLKNKTILELDELLDKIRLHLNNRQTEKIFDSMVVMGSLAIEKSIDPFYECSGFSDNLCQSKDFWTAMETYKIENGTYLPDIPPYIQLMYIMSSTLMLTHQLNKVEKNSKKKVVMNPPVMNPPSEEDISKLENDLNIDLSEKNKNTTSPSKISLGQKF